jgi:hypothetical protein
MRASGPIWKEVEGAQPMWVEVQPKNV